MGTRHIRTGETVTKLPHRLDFSAANVIESEVEKFRYHYMILSEESFVTVGKWIANERDIDQFPNEDADEENLSKPTKKRLREFVIRINRDYVDKLVISFDPINGLYRIMIEDEETIYIEDEKYAYEVFDTLESYFFDAKTEIE